MYMQPAVAALRHRRRQFFQQPTVAQHVTPHAEPREPIITVTVEWMRSEHAAGSLNTSASRLPQRCHRRLTVDRASNNNIA
jgi:hypothetical protein